MSSCSALRDSKDGCNAWSDAAVDDLPVRGIDYLKTKKKVMSASAAYTMVGLDLMTPVGNQKNIAADPRGFVARRRRAGKNDFLLVSLLPVLAPCKR